MCSSITVLELVTFPDHYPDKLAAVRKLCRMLAAELGMTKADLHPNLLTKLEEFQKADDPPASEQLWWNRSRSKVLAFQIFQIQSHSHSLISYVGRWLRQKNAQGQARNIGSWSLTHLFQGNLSKVYRSLTLVLIHYVFMATCNYMGLYNGNKPQIEFKTRWFVVQTLVQASIMFPFNVFRSHLQLTKLTHSPGKRSLRRNPRLCPKRGPSSRSPKEFRHRFGRQNFVS